MRAVAVAGLLFVAGGLLPTGPVADLGGYDWSVPGLLATAAAAGFVAAGFVLLFAARWSFWVGLGLTAVGLAGLGGLAVRPAGAAGREVLAAARGLEFARPWWLVLLGFVPVVVHLGRKSLGGLGPTRRRVAVGLRATIVALLAMALAEPRVRRPSDTLTVLFVADRSYSVPPDPSAGTPEVDRRWERVKAFMDRAVRAKGPAHRDDLAGLILFGRRPKLALPPAPVDRLPAADRLAGPIDGNYTDIAAALKLALASFPEGSAKRVVVISDGNQNLGSAEEVATVAAQNGVVIDALALAPGFRNQAEVLVQAVEAPPVAARGVRLPVRVLVRNAHPDRLVDGRLEVLKGGGGVGEDVPVDIEDGPQVLDPRRPPLVRLYPGLNVFRFRDRAADDGDRSFSYRATFVPTGSAAVGGADSTAGLPGDRAANNRAAAAVVTRGQRRVLVVDEAADRPASPHAQLMAALARAKFRVDHLCVDRLPQDRNDLAVFLTNVDCLVLADVGYDRLSRDQDEAVRAAVHDQGCGLVAVGGPNMYGPGGYQGSAIEQALPVDCDIQAIKAAGKGGLVLVMHASEMADGNHWQKVIAKKAIERLGPGDMVGVAQYDFAGRGAGVGWHIPFQRVGNNRSAMFAALDRMTPGDMPDFDPFLTAAADTLADPNHNLTVRHCIVISDGDPQYGPAGKAATAKMAADATTCTTVGVATHGVNEDRKMQEMAAATKDGAGKPGNFYKVADPTQLPGIYIKESRRVSQSFIYDRRFAPALRLRGGPTDGLPADLPPLHGFVRTTAKPNPLVEMHIEGPPVFDQRFPVLAAWRYGLGKAVAWTADARTRPGDPELYWDRDWAASDVYQKFWEQAVGWAMREAERGRLALTAEYRDGRVRVTADVRDDRDKPVGGLDLVAKVTRPEAAGPAPDLTLKPRGGGLYEADFPADDAGAYFVTVQARTPGGRESAPAAVYDAARVGVTVPYSPEFADLESNPGLLKRLAEATGGRYLEEPADDAGVDDLVRQADVFRPAPDAVRAVRPFWFWLVLAAGLLLPADVGVRRVAVDPAEAAAAARRLWARLRAPAPRAADADARLDRLQARKRAVDEAIERERAARRFDPASAPATAAPAGADEFAARSASPPPPPAVPPPPPPPPAAGDDDDDPLSRLRKARDRAKHRSE